MPSNALLIDELEERLQLIEKLEEFWEDEFEGFTGLPEAHSLYQPFGPMQVASLIIFSLADLRKLTTSTDWEMMPARRWIYQGIWKMPALSNGVSTSNPPTNPNEH